MQLAGNGSTCMLDLKWFILLPASPECPMYGLTYLLHLKREATSITMKH